MFDPLVVCCFRLFQDMGSDIQLDGQDEGKEGVDVLDLYHPQLPWYQHDMFTQPGYD